MTSAERYVVFERAGRRWAFRESALRESAADLPVTPVPLAGPLLAGLVALHGHPLPVVDLGHALPPVRPDSALAAPRRLLAIEAPHPAREAARLALVIDHDLGPRTLVPGSTPARGAELPPFVLAPGHEPGTQTLLALCLDLEGLLEHLASTTPGPAHVGARARREG